MFPSTSFPYDSYVDYHNSHSIGLFASFQIGAIDQVCHRGMVRAAVSRHLEARAPGNPGMCGCSFPKLGPAESAGCETTAVTRRLLSNQANASLGGPEQTRSVRGLQPPARVLAPLLLGACGLLRRLPENDIPGCAGYSFVFKACQPAHSRLWNGWHNAEDGRKDKQAGMSFDRNRLKSAPVRTRPCRYRFG